MTDHLKWIKGVFSAHAEVVPRLRPRKSVGNGILRARGGSSNIESITDFVHQYSPRTRR